jgi:hypothetical protein
VEHIQKLQCRLASVKPKAMVLPFLQHICDEWIEGKGLGQTNETLAGLCKSAS